MTPWSSLQQLTKECSGLIWNRLVSWVITRLCTCTARSRSVTQQILTHAARRDVCMTDVRGHCIVRRQMTRSIIWPRDHSFYRRKTLMEQIFKILLMDCTIWILQVSYCRISSAVICADYLHILLACFYTLFLELKRQSYKLTYTVRKISLFD